MKHRVMVAASDPQKVKAYFSNILTSDKDQDEKMMATYGMAILQAKELTFSKGLEELAKVKGYFTHLRNQPFYIDLNAIGVDEDDRMEVKRIFNSYVKEQEQGHDWTMRNLIKQMTSRQNQHDEMIAQKREQFFEMIKQ